MIATVPFIEKRFEEFNNRMFGGRLPRIPVELSKARTYLGICTYKKRKKAGGLVEHDDYRLRVSTRFDLPEQELEDTIIHEMIHCYIGVCHLKDTSSHGETFRKIMNFINARYGRHVTISHKLTKEQREAVTDRCERWHVVAVVELKEGRTGVKVLPRIADRILRYYNLVGGSDKVLAIRLYLTKDPFFNRYPNSSALNVVYANPEELSGHLDKATPILCDGEKLVISSSLKVGCIN